MIDKQKFTTNMTYLGMAYGKEYTAEEIELHYDFLKHYTNETMVTAIKSIIKKSRFLPKVSDLVEECEKYKDKIKYDVIEYMNKKGYFKEYNPGETSGRPSEYDRTIRYIEKGLIPEWLERDMRRYYQMMIKELSENKLEGGATKLLGN